MDNRFASLPTNSAIYRFVRHPGGHFPAGHRFPLGAWLEPTQDDVAEGAATGRRPGVSAWNKTTTPRIALAHRGLRGDAARDQHAFVAAVETIRTFAGARQREVDVVTDPVSFDPANDNHAAVPESERAEFAKGLEGHALIEGLRRPEARAERPAHQNFLAALAEQFEPMSLGF